MGVGDEIMAAGRAKRARQTDDRKVIILDGKGRARGFRPQEREIFALTNDIFIPTSPDLPPRDDYQYIVDGPSARPYVDYELMKADFDRIYPGRPFTTKVKDRRLPWHFNRGYRPEPANFALLDIPKGPANPVVVLQPYGKPGASPGKNWPMSKWVQVAETLRMLKWELVTIGPQGTPNPLNLHHHVTPTFADALRYLSTVATAIVPDGGIQHGMAAIDVPAVVIFGGFTSPEFLGYDIHRSFWADLPETPCGQWVECDHCKKAMDLIEVDEVAYAAGALAKNRMSSQR